MVGKGFGRWNTIPIFRRNVVVDMLKTSSPLSRISPCITISGYKSCILLIALSKVLFPHPEGPMMAVMECLFISAVTPFTAGLSLV
jgi:hypothetical protein